MIYLKPILKYGGEFFGHTEQSALKHVLLKIYKYALELPLNLPNAGVLGELGCFPLFVGFNKVSGFKILVEMYS